MTKNFTEETRRMHKNFQEELDKLAEEFREYVCQFVKEVCANTNIAAIGWAQYTPYFNDGDACTFGVHDFDFYDIGGFLLNDVDSLSQEKFDALDTFQRELFDCTVLCEQAFGEGEVRIYLDGTYDVNECYHD